MLHAAHSHFKSDLSNQALAIGVTKDELHFLYELHPDFAAFPTFPINLAFKQTDQDVFDFISRTANTDIPGTPPFDPQRSVDGERGIEILRPIPTSSTGLDLELRGKVIGVYDKGNSLAVFSHNTLQLSNVIIGGNMILEAENTLLDVKTNTIYAKMTNTSFGIGQGGYGGPRGPSKPLHSPPDRFPDAVHVFQTSPEQALLYRLCGDYNPMHADDAFGKNAGFKRSILQGLGTWNIAAHGVLKMFGDSDPKRFKSFSARFASVVYPGDALETKMWKIEDMNGSDEIRFQTTVMSDGRLAL